jgi:hypothetical protein
MDLDMALRLRDWLNGIIYSPDHDIQAIVAPSGDLRYFEVQIVDWDENRSVLVINDAFVPNYLQRELE